MAIYEYYCEKCDYAFDIMKPMVEIGELEFCPRCGIKAERQYTPVAHTFGWTLSEDSHIKGHKDRLVRDI